MRSPINWSLGWKRRRDARGDFYGWATTRVGGLLDKAPIVQQLALHPEILALARSLLEPNCDFMQLNLTQATRVHPGGSCAPWRRPL